MPAVCPRRKIPDFLGLDLHPARPNDDVSPSAWPSWPWLTPATASTNGDRGTHPRSIAGRLQENTGTTPPAPPTAIAWPTCPNCAPPSSDVAISSRPTTTPRPRPSATSIPDNVSVSPASAMIATSGYRRRIAGHAHLAPPSPRRRALATSVRPMAELSPQPSVRHRPGRPVRRQFGHRQLRRRGATFRTPARPQPRFPTTSIRPNATTSIRPLTDTRAHPAHLHSRLRPLD